MIRAILIKFEHYETLRFLVVGGVTVLVDVLVYSTIFFLGFSTSLSKGVSFSAGALFSYFANRKYTFKSSARKTSTLLIFCLIYLSTLIVNIITNELVLELFDRTGMAFLFAFLLATAISATLNFIGMKRYVFFKEK